jgi:DNA polymerase-3 subunit delta'
MNNLIPAPLLDAHSRGVFPQATLLEGPPGVGKKKIALALAELLTASSPLEPVRWLAPLETDDRASESKVQAATQEIVSKWQKNPYHTGLESPVAEISIEMVRRFNEALRLSAEGARALILPGAQNLNSEAANALLKTLEEAPRNTYFILTAPSKNSLLKTIQSRCSPFAVPPLDAAATRSVLAEYGYTDPSPDVLGYAQGSPGLAMNAIDHHFNSVGDRALHLAEFSFAGQVAQAFSEIDSWKVSKEDALEDALFVLEFLALILADRLRALCGQPLRLPGFALDTFRIPLGASRLAALVARIHELSIRAQDRKLSATYALQDACLLMTGEVF